MGESVESYLDHLWKVDRTTINDLDTDDLTELSVRLLQEAPRKTILKVMGQMIEERMDAYAKQEAALQRENAEELRRANYAFNKQRI